MSLDDQDLRRLLEVNYQLLTEIKTRLEKHQCPREDQLNEENLLATLQRLLPGFELRLEIETLNHQSLSDNSKILPGKLSLVAAKRSTDVIPSFLWPEYRVEFKFNAESVNELLEQVKGRAKELRAAAR